MKKFAFFLYFLLPLSPFTFAINQHFSIMAKELIDILTRAAEVRDETGAAENTASKVGCILTDLIDFIEKYQQSSNTVPVITTAQLANHTYNLLILPKVTHNRLNHVLNMSMPKNEKRDKRLNNQCLSRI